MSGTTTIKLAFAADYAPGCDRLYTYQTADALVPGQLVFVPSSTGYDKAMVISVDKVFDKAAEARFGPLKFALAEVPK